MHCIMETYHVPEARPATLLDAITVSNNLRLADQRELQALNGVDADFQLLLARSWKASSQVWTIVRDNVPIGIFGVAPVHGTWGAPWMLATDELPRIAKSFLKHCPMYVEIMLDEYPNLINYAHKHNKVHLAWLKHLGFTLMPTVGEFQPFIKTRGTSNV